jgi:hypothetical protein
MDKQKLYNHIIDSYPENRSMNNLLWSRAITPSGRLIKEPTILGVILIGVPLVLLVSVLLFLGLFL